MPKDTGLNPRIVANEFPIFEEPIPVGYFSVDSQRFYKAGHDNLRYFEPPKPDMFPLDLNAGIEMAKRKVGNRLNEGIDNLFRYIFDNYQKLIAHSDKRKEYLPLVSKHVLFPIEFVCWRGLLRLIMCTPFEKRQDWIIDITHYKGTFYFCQKETEEAKDQRINQTAHQKRMCAWGYKFEQYCLVKSPGEQAKTAEPVDECSEFGCIFRGRVGSHTLLYGAEMDGIRSQYPVHLGKTLCLNDLEFIELKTSLKNMNERQRQSYLSNKTRNWWCQSFLVGIKDIIVGWRDNDGFVHNIEEVKVKQLSKIAKNWNANQCAKFLVMFLDCIKNLMAKVDSPYTVWEFKYKARQGRIIYDIFEGCSEKTFLPEYYIDFIQSMAVPTEETP